MSRPLTEPPVPRDGSGSWRRRVAACLVLASLAAWNAAYLVAAGGNLLVPAPSPPVAPADDPDPSVASTGTGSGAPGATPSMPVEPARADRSLPSVAPETPPLTASAAPGTGGVAPASPVPAEPVAFGMSGHLMWHDVGTAIRQLDLLARDHLRVVRFDVSWRGLEPRRGHYAYLRKLDRIVDAAVGRGIRPIVTIVETPGWANGGRSAWVPPDDADDYAAFAAMLARRYAGRVDAWEVWNEPDIPLFWRPAPDAAAYAHLLRVASAAIRRANPDAVVVGGSVTFGNVAFVKALYAHGAGGSFDALSVHPYTLTRAPGDERDRYHSLTAILDDVHAVMAAEGDETTPVWITELGWAVVGVNRVTRAERARYLAESVRIVRERPWVGVVTMYTINTADSVRYGLTTGGRRSAAWRAYVAAVKSSRR